ncbi:MAG TPA: U-box domain-containing protein [Gammaproteobacteria bacterium]|jgi:hypothetical protein|nr:U-box domain-containing protein [Gammaproteobacteria bacterium]
MYTLTIYNEKQEPIIINNSLRANTGEIATHFIQTISIYVDLLNGGQQLNHLLQSNSNEKIANFTLSSTLAPQMAFVMFVSHLHNHPYFSAEKMNDDTNPNKAVFNKISELLRETSVQSRAARIKIIDVLQRFIVPGIGKILIESDTPANEKALDAIDFPEALIPEAFNCSLTNTIMDDPCYDPINKETIYDRNNIVRHLAKNPENSKNPYTNTPLKPSNLKPADELKAQIQQFICNANFIANLFLQKDLGNKFKAYIEQIKTASSIEALKQSLKEIMSPDLIKKYKIINTSGLFPQKSDLEKCLRRAASEANLTDVSIFITLYQVDVDCCDAQHKKTPAHWVVQRFAEAVESKSKEALTPLQDCLHFLINHGANINLKANNGKTALEIYQAIEPALKALYEKPDSNTLRQ